MPHAYIQLIGSDGSRIGDNGRLAVDATIVDDVTSPGTPIFLDYYDQPSVGVDVDALSDIVPSGVERHLYAAKIDSEFSCRYVVLANGIVIASGRTAPGKPTDLYKWAPSRVLAAGTIVKVRIHVRSGAPLSDVGVYLQALDI